MGVPLFAPRFDTDHVRPFYDALESGELRLPACAECGRWYWYPPEVLACHPGARLDWRTVSPRGTVYSFATVERSLLPGGDGGATPYTILLVEPDAVPAARVVSLLVNSEGRATRCGMRVRLSPVRAGAHVLPAFEPLPDTPSAA